MLPVLVGRRQSDPGRWRYGVAVKCQSPDDGRDGGLDVGGVDANGMSAAFDVQLLQRLLH